MFRVLRFSYIAVLVCSPAVAQLDRGTITSTVTDPSGAAIPGVHVLVRNAATGLKLTSSTNQVGQYTQTGLPVGDYEVRFVAPGFKGLALSKITVQATDVVRIDGRMELGSVGDSVEVTEQVTRLATDSPEVNAALDSKALAELPLSFNGGRQADEFAFSIMPGVQGSNYTSHINWSTEFSKDVLLEGATSTANQSGDDIASYVLLEALQEVKIQTCGLSAEFGRTQGGIFNLMMKSWTNEVHGSAFGALRNEILNANTFANNNRGTPRAKDRENNYAFSLGGPVWLPKIYNGHNKTFIYGSSERYSIVDWSQSAPNRTEPVPEFYQGDFSLLLGQTVATEPNLFVSMLQRIGIESDKFASSTGTMRGLDMKA
jgi:hypothetical protein